MRTANPNLIRVWNRLKRDFTTLQGRVHSCAEVESLSDKGVTLNMGLPHGDQRGCIKPFCGPRDSGDRQRNGGRT